MGEPMQLSDRIGCRMKLHDLHVLMAVVQEGSMSKAAKLLNTGQPAISRSIADLEHALRVRLVDRNRQGVKPTEYGRALLDGGTAVFHNLRQAVEKIAYLADPSVGEVRVGCNPFLAATFVTAVVDRLSRRYQRITFSIVTGNEEALHRELTGRNVDLLVTWRSGPILDDRLDYEVLYEDTYSVTVGARSPWARRRKVELAELANERWVLPPQEGAIGLIATKAFQACGLYRPMTTVIVDPAEARISLLATGRFVSIFPDSVLRFYVRRAELKTLRVTPSLGRVAVGVATLKNNMVSPVAGLFIETCRKVAQQLGNAKDVGRITG
jgi:DNA-binding transcriptional LysR family regulator